MLETEFTELLRCGADKGNAVGFTGFRKFRIFREKTVAGDDGLGAGVFGGLEDQVGTQITFRSGLPAQRHGFVSGADMLAVAVCVGIHRH